MIACYHSPLIIYFIFILFTALSSINSTKLNEHTASEFYGDFIDESRYHRASYKHEQALLEDIYSSHRNYISTHDNYIEPLNFSYFTFNKPGTYRFILITFLGDADMYISTRDKYVSYENYEYSSCTCGIDEIFIGNHMKRPIYIGIYGYSQYQTTFYRLLVEIIDNNADEDVSSTNEQSTDDTTSKEKTNDQHPSNVFIEKSEDKQHFMWNLFLGFLNFLVEVLA